MTTPRLNEFAAYMMKRHRIYLDRKAGKPGPWTFDPVLANGRFCNIFRELDTVTIWVDENIRKPFADHPNLWFMLAIARYINWPETLAELIAGPDTWPSDPRFCPERLTWALEARAARGEKVYTGAYMIRAESNPKAEWYSWSKHRYIAEIVLGRLWEDRADWATFLEDETTKCASLQKVWEKFQQPRYIGWGPFMAYEVVTDMCHTRYLHDGFDRYTWANAGPGAIRGLNRLYGRPLDAHPPASQTNDEMWKLMLELNCHATWPIEPYNPQWDTPKTIWGPRAGLGDVNRWFEMRDVEHTLCEFDKYERVRLGEGKMRSKYDWRKATKL